MLKQPQVLEMIYNLLTKTKTNNNVIEVNDISDDNHTAELTAKMDENTDEIKALITLNHDLLIEAINENDPHNFFETFFQFSMTANQVVYYAFITANDNIKLYPSQFWVSNSDVKIEFFEDASFASGTLADLENKNRKSAVTTDLTVRYNLTTPSNLVNLISTTAMLSGTVSVRVANTSAESDQYYLKNNSVYVVRVTNLKNATADVYVKPKLEKL